MCVWCVVRWCGMGGCVVGGFGVYGSVPCVQVCLE